MSQIGNLPQVGMNIENIWNHHLVMVFFFDLLNFQKSTREEIQAA